MPRTANRPSRLVLRLLCRVQPTSRATGAALRDTLVVAGTSHGRAMHDFRLARVRSASRKTVSQSNAAPHRWARATSVATVACGITIVLVLLFAPGCSQKGNVFSLEVGDCFNAETSLIRATEHSDVDKVSCSAPHKFEVYFQFDLTGSSWPGESTVTYRAEERCLSEFARFVGIDYYYSDWYATTMTPSEDSWRKADHREVVCLLNPRFGQTTGSARNSRR